MTGDSKTHVHTFLQMNPDQKRIFAVSLTPSGRADCSDLGVVTHLSDPAALTADYWTRSRLEELPSDREHSDAVLIGEVLVFVGGLERLVFISEVAERLGDAGPFEGLPLTAALAFLEHCGAGDELPLHGIDGFDDFGRSFVGVESTFLAPQDGP
jgi:hypothetical protein